MRIVTPPKESTAVLMTAAPSVTDDEFTTAFPPAGCRNTFELAGWRRNVARAHDKPLLISSTTFWADCGLKSFTTTFAPRAAYNRA